MLGGSHACQDIAIQPVGSAGVTQPSLWLTILAYRVMPVLETLLLAAFGKQELVYACSFQHVLLLLF